MNDRPVQTEQPATPYFVPPGTATFGLALFLVSLTMLFIAGMVGYTVIRLRAENADVQLPLGLWVSTFVILISSVTLHYAYVSVKADRQQPFRRGMLATTGLGYLFLVIQGPMLYLLLQRHAEMAERNVYLYSLVVALIVLHALHVIGGIIPMTIRTVRAFRGRYGPDRHRSILHALMYWHFLDVVWVVMFNLMLLLG